MSGALAHHGLSHHTFDEGTSNGNYGDPWFFKVWKDERRSCGRRKGVFAVVVSEPFAYSDQHP